MRSGFRVGRLFGIDIYVDWSWLVIFVLVSWNLAGAIFPQWHPDWGAGLDWLIAIIAALIFFASVLAHELAHSIVARARDLPVRRIVLFLFGGVSNIEKEPPSASTEFVMAIVGPLTSIVLGVIFLVLGWATAGTTLTGVAHPLQGLSRLSPLATLLLWLGPINIVIGLFNLIPAFPLDGGRVLRSIIWAFTANLRRATAWATWIGHAIAWLFIIAGIAMAFGLQLPLFGTGLINGIWLAFIGWFLNGAAAQSYQQVVVQDMLEGVPVSRLMQANPSTVPPDTSVADLVHDWIMKTDERSFAVIDGSSLAGMVSLDDVRKVPREEWDTATVAQIMTPAGDVATVGPRDDASEVFQKFAERDVRQMPVVENGTIVGMLRRRDLMRWLQLHAKHGGLGNGFAGSDGR